MLFVARQSPATSRLVNLLNFLASHPGESFRLSEIARRPEFNKATAHGTESASGLSPWKRAFGIAADKIRQFGG
jgi:hypothetical protein